MLNKKQTDLVNKIAKENGFQNFTVLVEEGSKKGDNYLGNISLITIKEKVALNNAPPSELGAGLKEKTLILKSALKNEHVREQMPIDNFYRREIFLYDTILPAFKELQEKYPLPHQFKAFAQMYGYSEKDGDEWLLLEDIKSSGFRMHNRKTTMNCHQISIVFKELAKLHSLSFVMNHVQPEQYKKVTANLSDIFQDKQQMIKHFMEGIKKNLINASKSVAGNEKATEALRRSEETIGKIFKDLAEEKNSLVIIHGDFWCNNIMFKYGDPFNTSRKPTEVCFLDWQSSRISFPVYDLSLFWFLSASKEILNDHKTYLRQYYQVLNENLKAVGGDINSVFPYEVFEDEWKRFCKIGFFVTMSMIEIVLKDEKDAKTFTDLVEDGEELFQANDNGSFSKQSLDRLKDIILMLVANDYL